MIKLSTMVGYIPKVCNQASSGSFLPFDNASFFKSLKFGVFHAYSCTYSYPYSVPVDVVSSEIR